MKRVFSRIETVFDLFYLTAAFILGFILILSGPGNSACRLAGEDTSHLLLESN